MTTSFQPAPTYAPVILIDPNKGVPTFNPIWLEWFLQIVALIDASGGGGGTFDHNLLSNLQGGMAPNEFFHFTTSEHSELTGPKSANFVLAGPPTGAAAAATFRALVAADLPAGTGSVTSVGLSAPIEFTVSGSPVTTSGTLTFVKANQSANLLYAGPSTGAAAAPTFRSLVAADVASNLLPAAKLSATAASVLFGRGAGSGAGDGQEITLGTNLSMSGTTLNATGSGGVTGPGSSTDRAISTWNGTGGNTLRDNSTTVIDSSGRLIQGGTTNVAISGINAAFQVQGTTDDTSGFSVTRWSNNVSASNWTIGKSRGTVIGTNTIVQNGDAIGSLSFSGANGTTFDSAASIGAEIDGTPGASNDMPGRLLFKTTPDGSASPATRMTIKQTGTVLINTTTETASSGKLQIGTNSDTTVAGGILWGTDTALFRGGGALLASQSMLSSRVTSGTPYTDTTTSANLFAATNNISMLLIDNARTANNRKAELVWGNGQLACRYINDAYNSQQNIWTTDGGQSTGVTNFIIPVATNTVIGHTASVTVGNAGRLQITGTTDATTQSQLSRFSADASGVAFATSKSRSGTAGTNTIVQSGDNLGKWIGYGANGSTYTPAAQISMNVDGTPGATNDMPGNIIVSTTPDGSGTLTEAWRVDNAQKTIFQTDRALRFNNQTSAAGANLGTINNAPTVGDPGYWLKINIAGTNYAIPAWVG